MRLYFSGWHSTRVWREKIVLESGWLRHRCLSYAMIAELKGLKKYAYVPYMKDILKLNLEHGTGIMMDSGAYSYRRYQIKTRENPQEMLSESEFIQGYAKYCEEHGREWDFYVTVDLSWDAAANYKRHCVLEKMGIRPVPVFHGDESVDYIRRYADRGYDLIAIGSPAYLRSNITAKKRFLDVCFNAAEKVNVRLHGLAMTAVWQLFSYPYWSVDSSAWTRHGTTGCIMRFDAQKKRMAVLHISDAVCKRNVISDEMPITARLRSELKAEGFEFDKLRSDLVERHIYNARSMVLMAKLADRENQSKWQNVF